MAHYAKALEIEAQRKRSRDTREAGIKECLITLDAELQRSRVTYDTCKSLNAVCLESDIDDMSLFVGFVFETVASKSVYSALHHGKLHTRTWLHPQLDVNDKVQVRRAGETDPAALGVLTAVKFFNKQTIGIIETANADSTSLCTKTEVLLSDLEAVVPIDIAFDPMLPCGEIVVPHMSSHSTYLLALSKLCEKDKDHKRTFASKRKAAWDIADKATLLARTGRLAQKQYSAQATQRCISVKMQIEIQSREKEVLISLQSAVAETFPFDTSHTLVLWQYEKLRKFFFLATNLDDDDIFHYRLFIMLQRYTAVTGLFSRIEAGWHAAVPPSPFDHLRFNMNAEAECFASPLNARLEQFCSAFPDTDHFFGSKGSFIEFTPRKGCFEVGPPYDHEVMRIAFDHAIALLDSPLVTGPLCFVFIIPESNRENGLLVRAAVDKSKYNKVSEVLPKAQAKYIDGFQHRAGENRLICISCDTRIIILQNDEAVMKWPPLAHFEEIKRKWLMCDTVIHTN